MFSRISSVAKCRMILSCAVISVCIPLIAQTNRSSGTLAGSVVDSSGAIIPGAHISLAGVAVRSTQSDLDGTFRLDNLQSGTYQVEISSNGFAAYRNDAVVIAVGRTTRLDVQLAPAQASQEVRVSARPDALNTAQPATTTNIDRDRIEELPIPSRNYLNFTLLAPSLAPANAAHAQHIPGTEHSGFSTGGLRPSSNAVTIDGIEDDDEYTGLSRTEMSPEVISDFQIVNHGYAAQSGGSAGGSVDVQTRSGSTQAHGDAFVFVQNGALNSTPPLETAPHKPDEIRMRAGTSAGGRLPKTDLFYFVGAEQEAAHGEEASDIDEQTATAIDAALSETGPLSGFHMHRGFFPTTDEETELSGRLDHSFGAQDFMLRYAFTNNRAVNDAFHTDELTDASARGSAFTRDHAMNGSWTASLGRNTSNRLTLAAAQRRVALRSWASSGPGVVIAGIAEFGRPYNGNERRVETHFDIADDLAYQRGKHLFGFGAAVSHVALRAANGEGFSGLYVFPNLAALSRGDADFYLQSFGNTNTNFAELRSSEYVQDHWTPLHSLNLDLGIRAEVNRLPQSFSQNAVNLSPRLGFAWTPAKHWVIRGGFGTFVDRYLLSTVNRILEFDGARGFQEIVEGEQAASVYRQSRLITQPASTIAPTVWISQRALQNPYAETASFGIEREFANQWTLSAEYRHIAGVHMGRTVNVNLLPPITLTAANATSLGVSNPTPQQLGRLVFPQQRIDSAYDSMLQFQTEAHSSHDGATVTINRQFTEDFELMAGYTFAKTIDDASFDTEQPQDPYQLTGERASSLQDQRHRFVLSGLWILGPDFDDPSDSSRMKTQNAIGRLINGLEFAPILTVGSGFPQNPLTGTDSNREHAYQFASRPLGSARNSLRTPSSVNLDLRALKMIGIARGHLDVVVESFNLLNRTNVKILNTAYGQQLQSNAAFRKPIAADDPRRVQFSLDYEF